MLTLTLEMINSLSQAVGLERGDTIPPEIIKDIILHYMPIEPTTLNKWVNTLVKAGDEADKEREENPVPGGVNQGEQGQEGLPLIVPMTGTGAGGTTGSKGASTKPKEAPPKKTNTKLEKFIESYDKGNDSLIRETYFRLKKDMGFTNRFFGKSITVNNTYKLLHEKKQKFYKYSIYDLIKKEKMSHDKKLLEDKKE
jgi:hypothetical protein